MSHPARSMASLQHFCGGSGKWRAAKQAGRGCLLALLLELLICLWGNLEGKKAPTVLGVAKVIHGSQSRCQMSHGSCPQHRTAISWKDGQAAWARKEGRLQGNACRGAEEEDLLMSGLHSQVFRPWRYGRTR